MPNGSGSRFIDDFDARTDEAADMSTILYESVNVVLWKIQRDVIKS